MKKNFKYDSCIGIYADLEMSNNSTKMKVSLNITVDSDVLDSLRDYKEKGHNINLSWLCERALREKLKELEQGYEGVGF